MSPSCVTQDRAESVTKKGSRADPWGGSETPPTHACLLTQRPLSKCLWASHRPGQGSKVASLFKEVRWGLGALIIQGESWVPQGIQRKERRAVQGKKSNICNPKHFLKKFVLTHFLVCWVFIAAWAFSSCSERGLL